MENNIRQAAASDAEAILAVYAPYVRDTAVSFETEAPSPAEFAARIAAISARYPFLVYETGGALAGYAYASGHRERAAYMYDADVSIYLAPRFHGTGIACELYERLFALLKRLGYRNAYAGCTAENARSLSFHRKFGFTEAGTFHKTGYKFGRWHDVIWLEKTLNGDENPGKILAITDIDF